MKKKITFVNDYKVDAAQGPSYKKNQTEEMEENSANHFINKGVAVGGWPEPTKEEPAKTRSNKKES